LGKKNGRQEMLPTAGAAAMGLAVLGSLAAIVGIICLMEPWPRNGLVLLGTGLATIGAARAVLVMPQ
jgi:hypothetical protein